SGNLRTGRDSAQRLAIVRSGKYRIWSLTWGDVFERLDKPAGPQGTVLAGPRLGSATAFDLLISLLTTLRENGIRLLARDVAMDRLVANRSEGLHPEELARSLLAPGPVQWPTTGTAVAPASWFCGVLDSEYINGFVAVPQTDVADKSFRRLRVWLRLMDDRA